MGPCGYTVKVHRENIKDWYIFRITDLRMGKSFNVDLIKFQVIQVGSYSRGKWIKTSLRLKAELKLESSSPHTYEEMLGLLRRQATIIIQSFVILSLHQNFLSVFLEIGLQ